MNLQGGDGNILPNDVYYYYYFFSIFLYNLLTILNEYINIYYNLLSGSCNYKLFIVNIFIFFYFYYNYYRHIGIFHDILGRQSTRTCYLICFSSFAFSLIINLFLSCLHLLLLFTTYIPFMKICFYFVVSFYFLVDHTSV